MPGKLLLDTDVFSYLLKKDTRGAAYRELLIGKVPVLSFMTVAELDRWTLRRRWSEARCQTLETILQRFIIVPPDRALGRCWAQITEARSRTGKPIQCADAWIAATAVLNRVPLLTHNLKDYKDIDGLELLTPELIL